MIINNPVRTNGYRARRHRLRSRLAGRLPLGLMVCFVIGCGSSDSSPPKNPSNARRQTAKQESKSFLPINSPDRTTQPDHKTQSDRKTTPGGTGQDARLPATDATGPATGEDQARPNRTSLADLVEEGRREEERLAQLPVPDRPASFAADGGPSDDELLANGIRKLSSRHLTLFTDLPAHPSVDELPKVFDLAVPVWCQAFGVGQQQVADWRIAGILMRDRARFERCGLLPADLPQFLHGFQRGTSCWLYDQPSDYYRRHLLLHEGTHGFMNLLLGGAGPPWYMEGMAEYMATHRWEDGKLAMRWIPTDKTLTPEWGRVKIVKEDAPKSLVEIMQYGPRAHLRVQPYAWSWACVAFLDNHPLCQQQFRQLRQAVRQTNPGFSSQFFRSVVRDWKTLLRDWRVFVHDIEYGYDFDRANTVRRPSARPLPPTAFSGSVVKVSAAAGWQSSGITLAAGQAVRIEASGRYQVADQPKVWWCEPGGVTIRYYAGKPLGILLAAVVDETSDDATSLLDPVVVGTGTQFQSPLAGTLYFRINDSAAELSDNAGELTATVQPDRG